MVGNVSPACHVAFDRDLVSSRNVKTGLLICDEAEPGFQLAPASVGNTVSAHRFTRWNQAGPLLEIWGPRDPSDAIAYNALNRSKAVFYTPTVSEPARQTRDKLRTLMSRVDGCIDLAQNPEQILPPSNRRNPIEMLVIDAVERLSQQTLEHIRDIFDRTGIGVILIGMPGLKKRLERYPQL